MNNVTFHLICVHNMGSAVVKKLISISQGKGTFAPCRHHLNLNSQMASECNNVCQEPQTDGRAVVVVGRSE